MHETVSYFNFFKCGSGSVAKNGRSSKILHCNSRNRMTVKNVNWTTNNIETFKIRNFKFIFVTMVQVSDFYLDQTPTYLYG